MKKTWTLAVLCAAWLGLAGPARPEVKPNTLCTEGMVLQQKTQARIWGTADKGEKVTVQFRGKSASATADADGNWSVRLDAGDAGGPFDMTIAATNTLAYKNVLVGEVWVCSGQSNMEWSIRQCEGSDRATARGEAHNPKLRMFTVKRNPQVKPQTDVGGSWIDAKPDTVDDFSATAYFFGRDLQKSRNVPVGLIHTSWGGTRVQAWTNKETLDAHPYSAHEHAKAAPAGPPNANAPSVLYNGMIAPVLPYVIKGAIWYQGESNVGEAYKYRTLFARLIENWRNDWNQGDFPFYFVQLAPYLPLTKTPGPSAWAELREAQALTLKVQNTGMAVITDFGDEDDIHPTPKRPVGERLSLAARAQTYGEKVAYSGPAYKGMKAVEDKIILTFDHAGNGLTARKLVPNNLRESRAVKALRAKAKEGDAKEIKSEMVAAWRVDPEAREAELVGFSICGNDKVFRLAKAVIQGNEVIVSSSEVASPIAVRYGWANHPICNLFNREGLPASPFRTDDFFVTTQPKQ